LKKPQKTFDHTGFGLTQKARPSVQKFFWFFFSKKNCFLSYCRIAHRRLAHPAASR
jgi:hypothetical protein